MWKRLYFLSRLWVANS